MLFFFNFIILIFNSYMSFFYFSNNSNWFLQFFIAKYLSPQDCKNKRLIQSEKKCYKQISKLLVFLFSIIFYTNFNIISRAIIISLIFISLNLIIANYINNHK